MTRNELIRLGFTHRSTVESNGTYRHILSKRIKPRLRPPLYIYLVSIDATLGFIYQLRLHNASGAIVCFIDTHDELELAMRVLNNFK